MKSEQGIGDMKWKGWEAECTRGHSVLFLMRCSTDISSHCGLAESLLAAATSHPAEGVAHDGVCGKPVLCGKSLCNNLSWCVSLSACVCVFISAEDLLSAACLLMRGDLTDCPMWLIWRRAKLCSTPTAITPVGAQRAPFRSKRKLTHTYTHMKGGSCQSRTITGHQDPFRWKITLANQLLIESFSSAGGQWNAHNVLFPWNHSQSVSSGAFAVMLILIKCNYSRFFQSCIFIALSSDGWWW